MKYYVYFKSIFVTGTNGKSTTCKIINHILKKNKIKTLLGGNIGTPILSLNPKKNTYLIIEASSFQLAYSKLIKPDYALILNITNELEHDSSICLANLGMNLYVSYVRKYFLSFDEKYRITIDRNLKYSRLDYLQNMRNLSLTDDNSVILEIKY